MVVGMNVRHWHIGLRYVALPAVDEYLFSSLCNEVRLHDKDKGEPMAKDAVSLDQSGIRERLADGAAQLADLS